MGSEKAEGEPQQQPNEPKQNHYPMLEQSGDALEKEDNVVGLESDNLRKALEGETVKKVGGGRGRRGRMRSLSATSMSSGLSEGGPKSQSASSSPAGTPSVQTRSRSYRVARGASATAEASMRRKRAWEKEVEEGVLLSERKRKSFPSSDSTLMGSEGQLQKKPVEHEERRRGRRGRWGRGRPAKHARGVGIGRGVQDAGLSHEIMERGDEFASMETGGQSATESQFVQGLAVSPSVTSPLVQSPTSGDQTGSLVFSQPKMPPLLSRSTSVNSAGSAMEPISPKMKVSPISMSPPPTSPPIRSPVCESQQRVQSDSDAAVGSAASTPTSESGRKHIGDSRRADGKSETQKVGAAESRKKSPTSGNHGDRGKWNEKYLHSRMGAERKQESRAEGEESASTAAAAEGSAGRYPAPVLTVGAVMSLSPSLRGSMENRSLGFAAEQGYNLQAGKGEGKSQERSTSVPGSSGSPAMSPVSGASDHSPPSHPPPEQPSGPSSPSTEVPFSQALMASNMHLQTLPEGSNFSVPLNQGPSMAAQSATYFLSGTPPVQGLEFMGQPPTTPHTQVFAFYPSDTLFRPRPSVVDSTPATTNIATDSVTAEAPSTTTSAVTSPPHPPPLIPASSYQRGGTYPMAGDSSLPTSSAVRHMVMQQHAAAAGKGPYIGYPPMPQNSAGMIESMHTRQPMYQSFLVHHGHHPPHGGAVFVCVCVRVCACVCVHAHVCVIHQS